MLGTLFDRRFELKETLGRSDLGALYLATDTASGEMLALKLFAEGVDLRGEEGLRYLRAVERLRDFHHPHVLAPSEAGRSASGAFQATPYFPARPLPELIAAGALKLSEIVAIVQQVAEGLAALHRRRLVHGNLKPANILVSREEESLQAVSADPFLAWLRGPENALLNEAEAPWRAPEEAPWLDRSPDGRADLYALGTIAYWMLTGRRPFAETNPTELLQRRLRTQPPPPREWNAVVPERLSAIVARLLARNPGERYASAEALLADLRDWAHPDAAGPATSRPTTPPVPGIERLPTAGREGVREAVLAALSRAQGGHGAMAVLAGDPGSGRQTVIDSLRLPFEAAGALVLHTRVPREGWSGPFQLPLVLFQELLRRWVFLPDARRRDLLYGLHGHAGEHAALLTGLLPELATLLPDGGPPAPMPAERQRLRQLSVLAEAFAGLASREHPLVIALAGLERADPDSLDWLRHLFHRLAGRPVLILATLSTVPGWDTEPPGSWLRALAHHPALHWIAVPALTAPQATQALARALGSDADTGGAPDETWAQAGAWLHGHWGGHALAQRLALPPLIESGALAFGESAEAPGWRWNPAATFARNPPETVSGLIEAGLAALPEALYQILEPAAIFPSAFSLESLAGLLPEVPVGVVLDRLESLVERGWLLRTSADLRFAHDRLREAVYRRIAPTARTAWHQAAGAQAETPEAALAASTPPLLRLARAVRHFEQSGELSRAVANGLELAEEARRRHALHAACRGLEALLATSRDDRHAGALYAALGESRARLGDLEAAGAALAEALRRAPSPVHQADTLGMMAWVALAAGRREEALARAEEALRLLGEGLPAHAVGTVLARLATGAATRYHQMLAAAGAGTEPLPSAEEERLARLLELASLALSSVQPARAALADERILNLSVGRLPSPFTVRALLRLGGGDPSGDALEQAAQLAEARRFPHEAARVRLTRGRIALEQLEIDRAREALAGARTAFRDLGDPLGEAEALRLQLRLAVWQGPAPAVREAAQEIQALAGLVAAPALARLAEGWLDYGEALEGLRRVTDAVGPVVRAAEALPALGEAEGASELWALAAELYLLTDQPHSAVSAAQQAPGAGGTANPATALLRALLAEAHLAAALAASQGGADPAPALREGRRQLRGLTAEARALPMLLTVTLRAEVLDTLIEGDAARALARAAEGETLLTEQELRLPLAWLAFRTAQGLKALGHADWLTWGGKALTWFDALGAHLPRLATRRLLELAEEDEMSDEGAAADTEPRAPGGALPWPEGLGALLEPLAAGSPQAAAQLPRALLRWLAEAADAERAALFLPDRDGAPTLAETIPPNETSPPWVNRWLVERAWAEGKPQLLEHYQPPAEGAAGAWEAQSLLCLPIVAEEAARGAFYFTSTVSRRVFGEAERVRVAALAREAGLLLALATAMDTVRGERDRARAEARQARERAEWALAVSTLDDGPTMLAAYLRDVAEPQGFEALAAFALDRGTQAMVPTGASARFRTPLPVLHGAALAEPETARAREAMEQQQPLALRRENEPAPGEWEQALLSALEARRGVWLPLVARGESVGAVLLGAPDAAGAPGPAVMEMLQSWLRAIAPALQHAWERDTLRDTGAALGETGEALARRLAEARALLPEPLRPWLDPRRPEGTPTVVEGERCPVIAGQIRGWEGFLVMEPAAALGTLREYFRQVEEALALHHARLERIGDGTWLARGERGVESALWAARAVTELVRRWQTESERPGARRLRTGLGIHLGRWSDALAETEQRTEPLALGEGPALAKSLAGLNFRFHTDVLVSQTALEGLADPDRFELRPMGSLHLEHAPRRIRYHELYATRARDTRERMNAQRALWGTALQRYREGSWREAEARLREYLAALPEDRPARLFLRACRRRQS